MISDEIVIRRHLFLSVYLHCCVLVYDDVTLDVNKREKTPVVLFVPVNSFSVIHRSIYYVSAGELKGRVLSSYFLSNNTKCAVYFYGKFAFENFSGNRENAMSSSGSMQ